MKWFLFSFLLWQVTTFGSNEFSDFDSAQKKWTRDEIEERLGLFLQKDGKVGSYFTLDADALTLFDASEMQTKRAVEYRLEFSKQITPREKEVRPKSLIGAKIAIDPGHLGGPYSRLEERYIDIPPSLDRSNVIQFDEGTLSLLTALYLKVLLEKEGAVVMMTRDEVGKGVYQEDFFDWLKKNPTLWKGEVSLNKLFRKYYNPLDLRARAAKINAFKPDLSIIIHYNSHHEEKLHSSNHCVTSRNYNLAFIPGSFCRNELVEQESRYEFMRLVSSDHLEKSKRLSQAVLKAFGKKLGVPVVDKSDGAHYLYKIGIEVEKGIFARNLALTRLIHGPVCYGETLIQNNIDECVNLAKQDFVISGMPCSSRIKQVAEAYYDGIREYLLK